MNRMKVIFKAVIFASLLFTQFSCSKTTSFPPVGKVTKIEVTNNMSTPLKKITEKNQIAKITAFVDKNSSGWGGFGDWAGVPVPKVVINFYDGEKFKGHFGVGANFFETQRNGDFMSQNASEGEREEFLNLIGIDKSLAED